MGDESTICNSENVIDVRGVYAMVSRTEVRPPSGGRWRGVYDREKYRQEKEQGPGHEWPSARGEPNQDTNE